jgi:hypothetical protein
MTYPKLIFCADQIWTSKADPISFGRPKLIGSVLPSKADRIALEADLEFMLFRIVFP